MSAISQIQIEVALYGSPNFPPFRGEFPEQGHELLWEERQRTWVTATDAETVGDVLDRAADAFGITLDPMASGHRASRLLAQVGFHDASIDGPRWYGRRLVVVGSDGRARWGVAYTDAQYGDLLRASERRVIEGDPHRVYLFPAPPGGAFGGGEWQAFLDALDVPRPRRRRTHRRRLGGPRIRAAGRVIAHKAGAWEDSGATPGDVVALIARDGWRPEELGVLLGCRTAEAEIILRGLAFRPREDGRWVRERDSLEAALSDDALSTAMSDAALFESERRMRELFTERLTSILETGTPGPPIGTEPAAEVLSEDAGWRVKLSDWLAIIRYGQRTAHAGARRVFRRLRRSR